MTLSIISFAGLHQAKASTLTLGQAATYGVFTFGNFTESNTDSGGRVAVGGNFIPANNGGFTIASSLSDPAGVYDLVVAGNLTNNGYMLGGGDVFVGGNMAWNSLTIPHNAYVNGNATNNGGGSVGGTIFAAGACAEPGYLSCKKSAVTASPIDFLGAQTNLDNVSSSLAAQTANGTTSYDGAGTYTLTGTSSSLNVFNLSNGNFTGATINITAPAGSTVIVNVAGTSDSINGGSINLNGVSASNVIFNYSAATSISISSLAFNGTLLAPYATFTGNSGQLNGQLIVNNAQGTTEFHNVLFSGTLPSGSGAQSSGINADITSQGSATPEPATWAMMMGAGAMVYVIRRRKVA
jgi:choice-of-anchor A domain-containing protein